MEAGALLQFESGMPAVFAASGEAAEGYVPRLEIYGTAGTLQCSDPNMYLRPLAVRGGAAREIHILPGFQDEGHGLGVAELAWALRAGRQPRASGDLMYHVLDIMHAIHEGSDAGKHIELTSRCARPEAFDFDGMLGAFK